MQRSLYRGDSGAEDLRRLARRIPEHIDQHDASSLRDRQRQERAEAPGHRYASLGVGLLVGHVELGIEHHVVLPPARPDRIDGGIVRDPEQPSLRLLNVARPSARRARQRLLHDVLPVERRTHHPSAVAVQSRAHRRCQTLEVAFHAYPLLILPFDDDDRKPKDSSWRILLRRAVVCVGRSAIAASSSRRATCNV